MEDYLGHQGFELIKYEIPICYESYLKNILKQKGYNREKLFPDEYREECCVIE